ncbi:reverse transcriptase domain, reverse transcriptase zinc-binding domain protein [Tanacetum coccineum]
MARHYMNLFFEAVNSRPIFCSSKVGRIFVDDAQRLEMVFSENEVWEAIRRCGEDKAPGPNGFNFKFIRKTWEIIKLDLLGAIAWFWENMEISKGCNASFVTIIPKVTDLIGLGDYRPISLIGMGFGNKLIKWVDTCLRSSSMSILVNGSPSEEFGLERGVRQGDPLSPFLFILVAEGLNAIVSEAVEKDIFRGVVVGDNNVMVSHLQYADDTIFFGECKIYGIGINEEELAEMARWMGCGIGEFPFTYLGLPIGENMRRIKSWAPVVEKFKKRLADWKAKTMSFGGRLTLVKSILGSLPLGKRFLGSNGIRFLLLLGRGSQCGVFKGNKLGIARDIMKIGEEIDEAGVEFTSSWGGILGGMRVVCSKKVRGIMASGVGSGSGLEKLEGQMEMDAWRRREVHGQRLIKIGRGKDSSRG